MRLKISGFTAPILHYSLFYCLPVLKNPLLTVKRDPDSDEPPAVRRIRCGVAFLLNLGESLVGGAVAFKLENVHIRIRLYDAVCPSLGAVHLRMDILTEERKYKIGRLFPNLLGRNRKYCRLPWVSL